MAFIYNTTSKECHMNPYHDINKLPYLMKQLRCFRGSSPKKENTISLFIRAAFDIVPFNGKLLYTY